MQEPSFLHPLLIQLRAMVFSGNLRISQPLPAYTSLADVVVSGGGLSIDVAQNLLQLNIVESALYVAQARVINIRFEKSALFAAIANGEPVPCEAYSAVSEDMFLRVQFALYRAENIAADSQQWDYEKEAARKLAVALILWKENCKEVKQSLIDLVKFYTYWHESLLLCRAAKIRYAWQGQTNGDLTQKEAIQYPVSSALLARAIAITLRNGLHSLKISPTKDGIA